MKQIKFVASIIMSTLFLPSMTFAHLSLKGELAPLPPAPYNWTGFYAGLNAGLLNHTMNITDTQAATFFATLQQETNPKLTGGLQVGYRHQMDLTNVSGVYGAEFSVNFANAEFNKQYGSPFALYQLNSQNTLKTICLMELIGGIAAERTLLFLAAGVSWVNITGSTSNHDTIPFFNSFSVSKKEFGTALGAGVEYAFNDKFSLRFKVDLITPNTYSTVDNVGNSYQIANSIVLGTLGVNYKFA